MPTQFPQAVSQQKLFSVSSIEVKKAKKAFFDDLKVDENGYSVEELFRLMKERHEFFKTVKKV